MSTRIATTSAMSALIAGVAAALIYEVIYFLTSNHQVGSGLAMAALIGVGTFLVAFVLSVTFRQMYVRRS